jgi:hypothetical protein
MTDKKKKIEIRKMVSKELAKELANIVIKKLKLLGVL